MITGRCWTRLARAIPGFTAVVESNVTAIGVRHLDEDEAAAFHASAVRRVGIQSLRTDAPHPLSQRLVSEPAYLHLDLDVLDPEEGRMNEFAAPDGLRLDELKWCLAQVANSDSIQAASVTALDPATDVTGQAAGSAIGAVLGLVAAVAASSRFQR
jgi:arginase